MQEAKAQPGCGSVNGEQPEPIPGRESVTEALIRAIREREAAGLARYGRSLETWNGRSALRDALEEALDLAQYIQQEMLEREDLQGVLHRQEAQIRLLRDQIGELGKELFDARQKSSICPTCWWHSPASPARFPEPRELFADPATTPHVAKADPDPATYRDEEAELNAAYSDAQAVAMDAQDEYARIALHYVQGRASEDELKAADRKKQKAYLRLSVARAAWQGYQRRKQAG